MNSPAKVRAVGWYLALSGLLVAPPTIDAADAFQINRRIGRGVNLGNALEVPEGAQWGMKLEESYFRAVKAAGFQSVRLPIRWSAHAAEQAPYAIQPGFRSLVDWAVDQALGNGLVAVINIHHYDELFANPTAHRERFLALWRQMAEHYRGRPDSVVFELLNEPHDQLTPEAWNALLVEALKIVRASNPDRAVIVGPGGWNSPAHLAELRLPERDRGLIVTFHYYNPFEFTHQGASWTAKPVPLGRRWTGTTAEKEAIAKELTAVADWAKANRRPLYLGEFGAYEKADLDSRARWTRAIREEAEKHAMSWAYWEFGAGFGVYDRAKKAWKEPLLKALVPAGGRP
jgi:endoglucanase